MTLSRRTLITGTGITVAGMVVGVPPAAAASYTASGTDILHGGVRIAHAIGPNHAVLLAGDLNDNPAPQSPYRVSGSSGIYRTTETLVIATAAAGSSAAALVNLLNANFTTARPTPPGPPTLMAPVTIGPSTVSVHWTAPPDTGGSPITGYEVLVDGIVQ